MKEIYLAGGCFWGMQAYFDNLHGVTSTCVGYANGNVDNPTYDMVCHQDTGYAETIRIAYDEKLITLPFLLSMYFDVIDPTSYHKQGGDIGSQYRTGIYYVDEDDKDIIHESLQQLQKQYQKPIVVENEKLKNFYPAETYHQEYLKKNPGGYCHISSSKIDSVKSVKDKQALKSILTPIQYAVTQENQTEPPFQNSYWDHFEKGIYVDITTKKPLFISSDKFESGCGWPSFSKPIKQTVKEVRDTSHRMERIEVRSRLGDAHLGHVFQDGPLDKGGMRYCINSASLQFIPYDKMEEEGYQDYLNLFED